MNAPRWQLSLRGLLILVAVVAVALGLLLQYRQAVEKRRLIEENRRLAEETAQLRFELDLQQIGFALKVPTEALYHPYMPRGELDQLRWEAFEEAGVAGEFVPIYALHEHTRASPHLYDFPWGKRDLDSWKTLLDSFWEGYAVNHADDGASRLVAKLKGTEDFRRRCTEDREAVEEYLKPLLMRMTHAPEPKARYAAIEALLLLGDRSEIVRRILRQSLQRAELPRGASATERAKFYSWDPDKARQLIEDYRLERWIVGKSRNQEANTP